MNLQIIDGQLKLSKYYQTLMDYKWENNKVTLITSKYQELTINLQGTNYPISYKPPDKMRILVGIVTNTPNDNKDIIDLFYQKLA